MNYIQEQGQYIATLTKDEYRTFVEYIDDNYKEMYEHKISYEVRIIKDKFQVLIPDNNIISFEDIFKQ